jgi:hypothetical protein
MDNDAVWPISVSFAPQLRVDGQMIFAHIKQQTSLGPAEILITEAQARSLMSVLGGRLSAAGQLPKEGT